MSQYWALIGQRSAAGHLPPSPGRLSPASLPIRAVRCRLLIDRYTQRIKHASPVTIKPREIIKAIGRENKICGVCGFYAECPTKKAIQCVSFFWGHRVVLNLKQLVLNTWRKGFLFFLFVSFTLSLTIFTLKALIFATMFLTNLILFWKQNSLAFSLIFHLISLQCWKLNGYSFFTFYQILTDLDVTFLLFSVCCIGPKV